MKVKYLLSIFCIILIITSCKKIDVPNDTPYSIVRKIKHFNKEGNCLKSVYSYYYNAKTVYLFDDGCPEGCYLLLDKRGDDIKDSNDKKICECSFVGTYCQQDFIQNRTNEKLIWKRN